MPEQVPVQRTTPTTKGFARALLLAWHKLFGEYPTKAQAGVLWSQYTLETGRGAACWNWNIGNVKKHPADGFDWIALPGTWEIVNGKRVVLDVKNPGSWFRAYGSLDHAMSEHLGFLRNKRYAPAWPAVMTGDPDAFARKLRALGYYTAPADDYAAGLVRLHEEWMRSAAFEESMDELEPDTEPSAQTLAESNPATFPTTSFPSNMTEAIEAGIEEYRKRRDSGDA